MQSKSCRDSNIFGSALFINIGLVPRGSMGVFITLFDLFSGCDIQMSACTSSPSIIFLGIASGIGGTEVVIENNVFPGMFRLSL